MTELFVFILVIFFASTLQTSTGFGFSIMATPFLLLMFAPGEAVQMNLILSLVISLSLVWKIREAIDGGLVKRLVIGSLPGLPVGIFIFTIFDLALLKITVSLVLLTLTLFIFMNFRTSQSRKKDLMAGGFSGAFTTSIGMPGPPLLLYFSGTDTEKSTLRATTLAFYLYIYLVSLLIQLAVAGTSTVVWKNSLIALPVVAAGLVTGQFLFHRLNQKKFQLVTYGLLLFTGVYLLIETLV